MRRFERVSTLVITNGPLENWGNLVGDAAAVDAMLDRLRRRGHVLEFGPGAGDQEPACVKSRHHCKRAPSRRASVGQF